MNQQNNQRNSSHAYVHYLSHNEANSIITPFITNNNGNEEVMNFIESRPEILGDIKYHLLNRGSDLRTGDIISIDPYTGYRNDGLLIYDGTNIVPLYFDIDDYGSVLPQMKVISEFPIRYWKDIIEHNMIVFFDQFQFREYLNITMSE
jgi:ABC-type sulfate transport system substrate-binding protein